MADAPENLNQLAKEVFGDKGVPDLVPNVTKVQKLIPYSKGEKLGKKFVQTVRLAYPTGFTHEAGDGTAGVYTYQAVTAGTQKRAEVNGYQTTLRDQMSYEDAAVCEGDKSSFKSGTKYFFEGLQSSMRKRIEAQVLYGGMGIGKTLSSTNSTATKTVITLTPASWAAGMWAGMEGMLINFYNGSSIVSSGADAVFTLFSVDNLNRKITVTGTSTGIAALDTSISGGTRDIFFIGSYGKEMSGIHAILANTTTMFGIDAAQYQLWASSQYAPAVAGSLTFEKVKKAIAQSVGKGLDEDCTLLLNPSTWDDVSSDLANLRKTGKDEVAKVDIGSEQIVFHSQNGSTILVPTPFIKEGVAFGLCKPEVNWKRIGAADVTFNTPGFEDKLFLHLQDKSGVESRVYTHQGIICLAPGKQFLLSNIVSKSY